MKSLRCLDAKRLQNFCIEKEIEWVFNPPTASHMGGIWERQIRTIRKVLCGVLKNCRLTDEILQTVFCEVESIVNNRPLTKVSDDVNDLSTLTPNHFLMFQDGPKPIPGVFNQSDMLKKRWRYVQHLSNQFWKRWIREYLPQLQRRSKWLEKERNVKVGDLVLICDENTPRSLWPLGLVVETSLGRYNMVRSVKVRTKSNIFTRPITKIVMLEEC